jgi:hypothetical protein
VQLVQPLCTGLPADVRPTCGSCTGVCADVCTCSDGRCAIALLGMWNGSADGCPDDAAVHGSAGDATSDANGDAGPANVLPIADADVLCGT